MKVLVSHEVDYSSEYEGLEIVINDNIKFSVFSTDSVEDNTLSRNFADCFDIPELLRMAYMAGKNGEKFSIEYEDEDDEI